jgi:hypothetical protein
VNTFTLRWSLMALISATSLSVIQEAVPVANSKVAPALLLAVIKTAK